MIVTLSRNLSQFPPAGTFFVIVEVKRFMNLFHQSCNPLLNVTSFSRSCKHGKLCILFNLLLSNNQ